MIIEDFKEWLQRLYHRIRPRRPAAVTPRDRVRDELAISRDMLRGAQDVVPRFTIYTPSEELLLFIELSDDPQERQRALQILKTFLVFKQATGFAVAGESNEPNALTCSYVTRDAQVSGFQMITRHQDRKPPEQVSFSAIEWIDFVDPTYVALLPTGNETLTPEQRLGAELMQAECRVRPSDRVLH